MRPTEKWAKGLKPGALAGLVFSNTWYPIVFGQYKNYAYQDSGLEYYDLFWYDEEREKNGAIPSHILERAENVVTQRKKLYACYILSNATRRIVPLSENMLTKSQQHLYNAYKKRFNYEY